MTIIAGSSFFTGRRDDLKRSEISRMAWLPPIARQVSGSRLFLVHSRTATRFCHSISAG